MFPNWNIPGLGLAFVGVILMTKLMTLKEKDYLVIARSKALAQLKKARKRDPKKGEVEVLAGKICQARLFAFYFSGALAIALGFMASASS